MPWNQGGVRILNMSQGQGSAVPWPKTRLCWTIVARHWPVILDTQVPWSLHIEHYCYILLPSFDPIVHYK